MCACVCVGVCVCVCVCVCERERERIEDIIPSFIQKSGSFMKII